MTRQKKKFIYNQFIYNPNQYQNYPQLLSVKEQLHLSQLFNQNPKVPLGSYLLQPSGLVSEGPTTVSMNVATLENPAGNSSHSSNLMPLPKEQVPSPHLLQTWFFISRYSPEAQEKAGRQRTHSQLGTRLPHQLPPLHTVTRIIFIKL